MIGPGETTPQWLVRVLPGPNNELWMTSRGPLRESPEDLELLVRYLDEWAEWTADPSAWADFEFGDQARNATEGMRRALLAVTSALRDPTDVRACLEHAEETCRAFARATSLGMSGPIVKFPRPDLGPGTAGERLRDAFKAWEADPPVGLEPLGMARLAIQHAAGGDGGQRLDLFGDARGKPPGSREVRTPLLMTINATGVDKMLRLEWIEGDLGPSRMVADPIALGATELSPDFRESLRSAWDHVSGTIPEGVWVVWSIEPLGQERMLTGRSAGGAMAAALVALRDRLPFDPSTTLTATLEPGGGLGPVDGVAAKLRAAERANIKHCLVSTRQAVEETSVVGVEVARVSTVDVALDGMTGMMTELVGKMETKHGGEIEWVGGYLPRLARAMDVAAGAASRPVEDFFRELHLPMSVGFLRGESAKLPARPPSGLEVPLPWHDRSGGRSARREHPWAVILGPPGLGKSTLLRYEAWLELWEQIEAFRSGEMGVSRLVLPVYAHAPSLVEATRTRGLIEALADLLTDPRHDGLNPSERLRRLIDSKLRRGEVVLLLDSLEQVDNVDYKELIGRISGWNGLDRHGRVVMASRISGFRPVPLRSLRTTPLELVPLHRADVETFLGSYLVDDERRDRVRRKILGDGELSGLAQSPLTLRLLCETAQRLFGRELPATRAALFDACLEGVLGRFLADADPIYINLNLTHMRCLLARLTWNLSGLDPSRASFSVGDVRDALEKDGGDDLKRLKYDVDAAVSKLTGEIGILPLSGEGHELRCSFLHKTFQEFLLAWEMVHQGDWLEQALAPERLYNSMWSEVLVLIAGVLDGLDQRDGMSRTREYILALLEENAKDLLQRPLLLACRALGETNRLQDLSEKLADLVVESYLDPPPFLDPSAFIQPIARLGLPAIAKLQGRRSVNDLAALHVMEDGARRTHSERAAEAILIQLGIVEAPAPRDGRRNQPGPTVPDVRAPGWRKELRDLTDRLHDVGLGDTPRVESLDRIVAAYSATRDEIPEEVARALSEALSCPASSLIRWKSAAAMIRFRRPLPWLLEALLGRLRIEDDHRILAVIADTLGQLAAGDPRVRDALREARDVEQARIGTGPDNLRFEIVRALARFGPSLKEAERLEIQSVLINSLESEAPLVHGRAVAGIRWLSMIDLGPVDPTVAPEGVRERHHKIQRAIGPKRS